MMAPGGLGKLPRADPVSGGEEALRFARLEYGSSTAAWMLPPAAPRDGLLRRVAALFRGSDRAVPAPDVAAMHPLRSGLAEAHFAGRATRARTEEVPNPSPALGTGAGGYAPLRVREREPADPLCESAP